MAMNADVRSRMEVLDPESEHASSAPSKAECVDLLDDLVQALEHTLSVTALIEATWELRVETMSGLLERGREVMDRARSIARLDVAAALRQKQPAELGPSSTPADGSIIVPREIVVGLVRSATEGAPVDWVERLARTIGEEELGHRLRTAFDGLRAMLRRLEASEKAAQTGALGRAYAEGRLSLAECAAVLRVDVGDAIALLEEHGFARLPEVIELSPQDAAERLAAIRRARLAQTPPAADLVQRDVIASQRIEGIEARPWFRRP